MRSTPWWAASTWRRPSSAIGSGRSSTRCSPSSRRWWRRPTVPATLPPSPSTNAGQRRSCRTPSAPGSPSPPIRKRPSPPSPLSRKQARGSKVLLTTDSCLLAGGISMPLAPINGIEIYYEEHGQGAPIVFSHEFAGDYRSWAPQVRFFARRYRTITYCARGYPPSSVPTELAAYSEEQSVEDLYELIRFLGIEKAHVVGLSMGGNVALKIGLAHPEVCASLVVAGAGFGSVNPEEFRA